MRSLIISSLLASAVAFAGEKPSTSETQMILENGQSAKGSDWISVDDGVMGGKSQGNAEIADEVMRFSGELSLENNGGFSSVKLQEPMNFEGAEAVVLRIRGDGRPYQLRLSTNALHRGSRIAYQAEFATQKDEWVEVRVPFSRMKASHHGNRLAGPPLNLSEITEFGFLLSDKQAGQFKLTVDWAKLD